MTDDGCGQDGETRRTVRTAPLRRIARDSAGDGAAAAAQAPLYRRIEGELRTRIASGEWAPGSALPPRRQLCRAFATTRVTLDRAILEIVRDGLLISAKGSGTYVAETAARRPSGRDERAAADGRLMHPLRIGVILGRESPGGLAAQSADDDYYVGPLFAGIREYAASAAIDVSYGRATGGDYVGLFEGAGYDGMVLMTAALSELPMLRRLTDASVPFVAIAIGPGLGEDADLPCIDVDNALGAALAVRHLLSLGHTRLGVIELSLGHHDHLERMMGFLRALAMEGCLVDPINIVMGPSYAMSEFEPRIEDWLDASQAAGAMPTAVFTCDYRMTLALLRVFRRRGIRVPDDISVAGFDDPLSAEHLTPPMTGVRQPLYVMGRRAVERLAEHVRSGEAGPLRGPETLKPTLVVRESTARPRARAIR